MRKPLLALVLLLGLGHQSLQAAEADIMLTIPEVASAQYYRPYVAVWVEDAQQQPVKLIALWRKEPDWLKDIRRFWRKIGRSDTALVDAMTGATRTPGQYRLSWNGTDDRGQVLAQGAYTLYVEASREQGGRSLQKIDFQLNGQPQQLNAAAAEELGPLTLTLK